MAILMGNTAVERTIVLRKIVVLVKMISMVIVKVIHKELKEVVLNKEVREIK